MLKKCLCALIMLSSLSAFADSSDDGSSGYYLGINSGYSSINYKNNSFFAGVPGLWSLNSSHTTGVNGRVFAGYGFDQYLGLEVGYNYFPKATATLSNGSGVSANTYNFDLLFVVKVPFSYGFNFFVKGGMAYINSNINVENIGTSKAYEYRPAFAVGVDYWLTTNIGFNVQWYRTLAKANAYDGPAQAYQTAYGYSFVALPMIDTYTAGITYRF